MKNRRRLAIRERPLAKLKPYERNARTHTDAEIDLVAASIQRFGWTYPVLVDAKDGIIAGHRRVAAAAKLGLKSVPTILIDDLTEDEKRAYILADNQLALRAGWDKELLGLELGALKAIGFDLAPIGFELKELGRLGLGETTAGTTEPQLGALEYSIVVRCTDEAQQAELLDRFEREGLKCQALIS